MSIDRSEVDALFAQIPEVPAKAMEYMGLDFLDVVSGKVNRDENHLADSIQEPTDKSDLQWIIGTDIEYAEFVHEGTPPHWIEASHDSYMGVSIRQGYLSWPGADYPVRRVHHPGYAGNPFFDDSLDVVEERVDEYLTMATEDLQ